MTVRGVVARRLRIGAAIALASAGLACATTAPDPAPAPDPDATSEGAILLPPGAARVDLLACEGRRNDCLDLYRIPLEGPGRLSVSVDTSREAVEARAVTVALLDGDGQRIDGSTLDAGEKRFSRDVEEGAYFVALSAPAGEMLIPYRVEVSFSAARATPPPVSLRKPPAARPPPRKPKDPPVEPPLPRTQGRHEAISGAILELGGTAGTDQIVLIEIGEAQGIRPGMRGRLMDSGRVLGQLVIEEVFPRGSRARILGELRAPPTASARVEVDVPVGVPGIP